MVNQHVLLSKIFLRMNRDFKGIWIPKAIWMISDLKPTYRVFLAEIDSLDQGQGCYAELKHFMKMFGLSKSRCSEIITMLEKEGYITIETKNNGFGDVKRYLSVSPQFGKSNTRSENRTHGSENRTHGSENRTPIYKDIDIHIETNERGTALEFLKNNCPERLDVFLMNHKSQITNWIKFVKDFNNKVILEGLDFVSDKLFARLEIFFGNWVEIQNKQVSNSGAQPSKASDIKWS